MKAFLMLLFTLIALSMYVATKDIFFGFMAIYFQNFFIHEIR